MSTYAPEYPQNATCATPGARKYLNSIEEEKRGRMQPSGQLVGFNLYAHTEDASNSLYEDFFAEDETYVVDELTDDNHFEDESEDYTTDDNRYFEDDFLDSFYDVDRFGHNSEFIHLDDLTPVKKSEVNVIVVEEILPPEIAEARHREEIRRNRREKRTRISTTRRIKRRDGSVSKRGFSFRRLYAFDDFEHNRTSYFKKKYALERTL